MNLVRLVASGLVGLGLCGCVMMDIASVPEQQRRIDSACQIGGSVRRETETAEPRSLVVVLARLTGDDPEKRSSWEIADHFVVAQAGHWMFVAGAGTYGIVAFEDTNANLAYEPGEPWLRMDTGKPIVCKSGEKFNDIALVIPGEGQPREQGGIDVAALQVRNAEGQVNATLGQLTAVGDITTMDDPRFSEENALMGLWRPLDFMYQVRPGVYFLEPYDKRKIPVVFVHGINGSPAHFKSIVKDLDREKFQPWLYCYPSGAHLSAIADHLTQTMMKLEARHGFKKFYVVAHSMGGLVSRGFILRHNTLASRVSIPLFVSLSTPWGGHKGATYGVEMSPAVVRVWYDMAPGSDYLRSLYYTDAEQKNRATLAPATAHHMLFSFRNSGTVSVGEANDDTATVSSQLIWDAQRDAVRLYGFNETHMSILDSSEAHALLGDILKKGSGD